jgi:hypothetical protein
MPEPTKPRPTFREPSVSLGQDPRQTFLEIKRTLHEWTKDMNALVDWVDERLPRTTCGEQRLGYSIGGRPRPLFTCTRPTGHDSRLHRDDSPGGNGPATWWGDWQGGDGNLHEAVQQDAESKIRSAEYFPRRDVWDRQMNDLRRQRDEARDEVKHLKRALVMEGEQTATAMQDRDYHIQLVQQQSHAFEEARAIAFAVGAPRTLWGATLIEWLRDEILDLRRLQDDEKKRADAMYHQGVEKEKDLDAAILTIDHIGDILDAARVPEEGRTIQQRVDQLRHMLDIAEAQRDALGTVLARSTEKLDVAEGQVGRVKQLRDWHAKRQQADSFDGLTVVADQIQEALDGSPDRDGSPT